MSALQIVYMAAVYFHRLCAASLRHDTNEETALPMSLARFRKQSQELLLLAFLAAVIPSVGCSTSRQLIASIGAESARFMHPTGMAVSDESAPLSDTDEVSPIRMVAHQAADPHTNEVAVIGEVSDETVSFAAHQDAESPPVPYEANSAGGLTLEALEQLALANNPAIQQAAAVAARAGAFVIRLD